MASVPQGPRAKGGLVMRIVFLGYLAASLIGATIGALIVVYGIV